MSGVVILGTGLAGYNLAKEFRKLDKETPLKLITADCGRNYSKPMLSTGFTKGKDADALTLQTPEAMAETLGAEILTHTRVAGIDTDKRQVLLESGAAHGYDKLVLALGAEPIRIPMAGDAADTILSINDLEDYARFRERLPDAGRVVIIGGGLIGCEYANDLRNGGYEVDVVALSETVMPDLLPEQVASTIQEALVEQGAHFHMQNSVTSVDKDGERLAVTLKSGELLQADIVVSAIGLRPRTGLAQQAGLEVGRGVAVNRALETSAEGVYSLGDCAEVDGLNLLYVLPLMTCARALGKTLAGERTEISYGPMPVGVKTPACPLVVAPPAPGQPGEWQIEVSGRNIRALNTDGQNLYGFALTGDAVADKMQLSRRLPPVLG